MDRAGDNQLLREDLIATLLPVDATYTRAMLTDEQRRIVEHGDGPMVVIAGAGTGKTKVIVERVKWLLDTKEDLLPEQILVLTYNVKAARELQTRIEEAVGPATKSRLAISNFHSFCHRVLTESAAEADMPAEPAHVDPASAGYWRSGSGRTCGRARASVLRRRPPRR